MQLKAKTTTYEFTPDDIKLLIADNLKVDASKVNVHFKITEVGGDFRSDGIKQVTSIDVTVKEK
jgi:hypothetical protein